MKALHTIAFILVVVGAINWGLIGIGGWDVVNMILGKWSSVERIVHVLVGISGVLLVVSHKKDCRACGAM